MRLPLLAMVAVFRLAAQYPVLTTVPAGVWYASSLPTAAGPDGHVWIAGARQVMRLDAQGKTVFIAPVETGGSIAAIAVDNDGTAAVAVTDGLSSSLMTLSGDGRPLRSVPLAGIPAAMAADGEGNVFVAGRARDGFVGTRGAYKTDMGPKVCSYVRGEDVACDDAFLTKLRMDGTVVWSTLLGGSRDEAAQALALDASGAIWVAGRTNSSDMATTPGAFQSVYGGGETLWIGFPSGDAFLARIDSSGARLEYATYLGGAKFDEATALLATPAGVLVAGGTESANFPVSEAGFQRAITRPVSGETLTRYPDAFLSYFSRAGKLVYSTYYGQGLAAGAWAAAKGAGSEATVALMGASSRRCVAHLELKETVTKFTPECVRAAFEEPFATFFSSGNWYAAGRTLPGLPLPGVNQERLVTVQYFGGDNPGPGVAEVWTEGYPNYRTALAADSIASIYLPPSLGLEGVTVRLGERNLPVVYAGDGQVNVYVPADVPAGVHALIASYRFFSTIPVPVDVVGRWPGLADGALNQDGRVNSATNPARRGTIVSLFATGLGPDPLPVIEPYVSSTGATMAQGMEVLFAGRVGEGLFQINARVPMNAVPGQTPVRIVLRTAEGFLLSRLVTIWIQ